MSKDIKAMTDVYFLEIDSANGEKSRRVIKSEKLQDEIGEQLVKSSIMNDIISRPDIMQSKTPKIKLNPYDKEEYVAISFDSFAEVIYNAIINSSLSAKVKNYLLNIATPWTVGIEVHKYDAIVDVD